jgi:hypothetical protein
MVNGEEFERIRAEICASGLASDGDNLLGMEMDAFAYLGDRTNVLDDPVPWRDTEVHRAEGTDWLITARAIGSTSDTVAIADQLARIWEEHLRYSFRSALTVIPAHDSVTLLAVTQSGPGGIWVTADVGVALT